MSLVMCVLLKMFSESKGRHDGQCWIMKEDVCVRVCVEVSVCV